MLSKLKFLIFDSSLFRIYYMICLFFFMVLYVETIAYYAMFVLFYWGAFLSIHNIFKYKMYKKAYFSFWLFAFIISFAITLLLNINTNTDTVIYNFYMLLNCSICFFMFYGMHTEEGVPFRWELYLIARIFVFLTSFFIIVGFVLLFLDYSNQTISVYYESKLYKGFFTNPNYLGYASALCIIFCHMLTKPNFIHHSSQKRISRIWLFLAFSVSVVSLFLSNSSASLILLIVYATVIIILKLFAMTDDMPARLIISRLIALAIGGIILLFLLIFIRSALRLGVSAIFSNGKYLDKDLMEAISNGELFSLSKDTGYTSRMFLWKAGAEIFKRYPLFGIGKGNLDSMIIEVTGRTNFNFGIKGIGRLSAADLHNGFYTILVTAGIVGFILFMIFLIKVMKMLIPVWYVQRRIMIYSVYPSLIAFLFGYFVYAMFEKTVLFDRTYLVYSFWLLLSYAVCYAKDSGYKRHGNLRLLNHNIPKTVI